MKGGGDHVRAWESAQCCIASRMRKSRNGGECLISNMDTSYCRRFTNTPDDEQEQTGIVQYVAGVPRTGRNKLVGSAIRSSVGESPGTDLGEIWRWSA